MCPPGETANRGKPQTRDRQASTGVTDTSTRAHAAREPVKENLQCTQALLVSILDSRAMSGIPCKPGCMVRSRYTKPNARRQEAYRRQREANDAAAAAARERAEAIAEAQRSASADRNLQIVWGGRDDALARLRDISRQLEKLHRAELTLLHERDELVDTLRGVDVSWVLLSSWSGLSRQALSKRARSTRNPPSD